MTGALLLPDKEKFIFFYQNPKIFHKIGREGFVNISEGVLNNFSCDIISKLYIFFHLSRGLLVDRTEKCRQSGDVSWTPSFQGP